MTKIDVAKDVTQDHSQAAQAGEIVNKTAAKSEDLKEAPSTAVEFPWLGIRATGRWRRTETPDRTRDGGAEGETPVCGRQSSYLTTSFSP